VYVVEKSTTGWVTSRTLDDFAARHADHHRFSPLRDPGQFWVNHRQARLGPITILEYVFGTDMRMDCGEQRPAYFVNVPMDGRVESVHRGAPVTASAASAAIYRPRGDATVSRWAAGGRTAAVMIERYALEDALRESLGRETCTDIDFAPSLPVNSSAARQWITLLGLFTDELFCSGGLLSRPMVGLPFAECLVRGLLIVADHPHRDAVVAGAPHPAPRTIRAAIEIMEAEAHMPLTVASLAARCHVSGRSLYEGFRRHVGMSPMAYLREIRLRRAHQLLLKADPTTDTVASVAYRWGFTNLGRFAAAHAARYGETPVVTLRRTPVWRSRSALLVQGTSRCG
jgi:AraC-like DNA-binding protein